MSVPRVTMCNYIESGKVNIEKYLSDQSSGSEDTKIITPKFTSYDGTTNANGILNKMSGGLNKLYLEALGFTTFPLPTKTKIPKIKGWQKLDRETCIQHVHKDGMSLGIITGTTSDIFVIDIDNAKDGQTYGLDFLKKLFEQEKKTDPNAIRYSETLVSKTGSGGFHLFYQYEPIMDLLKSGARMIKDEEGNPVSIDFRSNGGYVVAPPSVHPSGESYKFINAVPGKVFTCPSVMPRWLLRDLFTLLNKNNYSYNTLSDKPEKQVIEEKVTPLHTPQREIANVDCEDLIEKKIRMLSSKRWDNYETWYRVIILLSNLSADSGDPRKYYDLCVELSKNSSEWNDDTSPGIIESTWEVKKKENTYRLVSLDYWLREDLPEDIYNTLVSKKWKLSDCLKFHGRDWKDDDFRCEVFDFLKAVPHNVLNSFGKGYVLCKAGRINRITGHDEYEYPKHTESEVGDKFSKILISNVFKDEPTKKERKYAIDHDLPEPEPKYRDGTLLSIYKKFPKNNYADEVFIPFTAKSGNEFILQKHRDAKNFNTFSGFPMCYDSNFKVDLEVIQPILVQVLSLCNNDKEVASYLVNWMASLVQKPQLKTEIGVVIRSDQGTGKTSFFSWFGNAILGYEHYINISCIDKTTGTFNYVTDHKLLIVVEEMDTHENDNKIMNRLKDLITNPEGIIGRKYFDDMRCENYSNYVFLTNKKCPVRVESSDRRYLCLEASGENIGNTAYWDKMIGTYKDMNAAKHFYHYMMNRDISNFNIRKIPMTDFKKELQMRSAPPLARFFKYLHEEEELYDVDESGNISENYRDELVYVNLDFHQTFHDTLKKYEPNYRNTFNPSTFNKHVKAELGIESKRETIDKVRKKYIRFPVKTIVCMLTKYGLL